MPSARLESDELKAQLVQALASVTQLTQRDADRTDEYTAATDAGGTRGTDPDATDAT